MNKSRIALAIAGAFGAVAMGATSSAVAQTSSVQIGGSFNAFYSISKPGANTAAGVPTQGKSHDNLSLSEPELWIHGEEKIGGATVWFRCTSSFDVFGTGASARGSVTTTGGIATPSSTAAAGAGQLCGRNSALGFKGNFGNVFAGTWDTPHKMITSAARGWWGGTATLTGGAANLIFNGSSSNTGNFGGTMYERRSRLISYHSPSFSGFNIKAAYSAANESTSLTTATLGNLKPRMWGASAEYANGPLFVGVGYEQHQDYNPGAVAVALQGAAGAGAYAGGKDKSWNVAAHYTFAFGTRLAGLWGTTTYEPTNGTDLKKSGWAIFVDHRLSGPHSIKGQYFKVGDSKGTSAIAVGNHAAPLGATANGAKGWSLAYMYDFSKRTQAGFVYGLIDNDTFATYSKGISTANPGATQKVYGLNVRHRF